MWMTVAVMECISPTQNMELTQDMEHGQKDDLVGKMAQVFFFSIAIQVLNSTSLFSLLLSAFSLSSFHSMAWDKVQFFGGLWAIFRRVLEVLMAIALLVGAWSECLTPILYMFEVLMMGAWGFDEPMVVLFICFDVIALVLLLHFCLGLLQAKVEQLYYSFLSTILLLKMPSNSNQL